MSNRPMSVNFAGLLEALKWFCSRWISVYLVIALIFFNVVDYWKLMAHVKAETLSRLMPSFDYLNDFIDGKVGLDKKKMEEYEYYYEKVVELVPPMADVYSMLGYCYYHLGNPKQAIKMYKNAIDTNQYYFTFYYNSGVIYFERRRYKEAYDLLAKALTTKIEYGFNFVSMSRIFFPLIKDPKHFDIEVKAHLREGWTNGFKLIILSAYYMKNFQKMAYMAKKAVGAGLDDDGFIYFYWGVANFHMQKYHEAGVLFQQTLNKNPQYTEAAEWLAETLKVLGQQDIYEKVLAQAGMLRRQFGPYNAKQERIKLLAY